MASLKELDNGTRLIEKSISREGVTKRPKTILQIAPNFFEARFGNIVTRMSFSSSVFFEGEQFSYQTTRVKVFSDSAEYKRLFQGKNQQKGVHLGQTLDDLPIGRSIGMDRYLYSMMMFLIDNEIINNAKLPTRLLKSIIRRGQRAAISAAVYSLIGREV